MYDFVPRVCRRRRDENGVGRRLVFELSVGAIRASCTFCLFVT